MLPITVDHRERRSRVFDLLQRRGDVELQTKALQVGDYVIDDRVVVERKTYDDFVDSVIDTRLFRQARQLHRPSGCGVVVLEGKPSRRPRLGRPQLQGALITLSFVFGVPLLRSRSPEETVWLLRALGRQSARVGARGFVARHPNPRDRDAARIHMLMGLPHVGPERAARLLARFGSLDGVFAASDAELAGVAGIGPVTAGRIRAFLGDRGPARSVPL